MFKTILSLIGLVGVARGGVISYEAERSTLAPPPRPYAFGYAAGRFPGHIDRTHSEVSDGSVVQGSYSYVDPRHKIRTVQYVADKNGFHPVLNEDITPLPYDTPVVAAAKDRHLRLYSSIANSHQLATQQQANAVPRDSQAVEFAKSKHLDLFQKIAAEHARIAAERKLDEPEEYEENHVQH